MAYNSKLTLAEQEILNLLTEDYLTPKQITIRRKCTRQAVSKILKKLKEKGAYNIGLQKVDKEGVACQPVNQIRIHAQQFAIKIIWKDHKYKKLLKKTNQIEIDGNTINLWPNNIEIYANQSFYGDTLEHALYKSTTYWQHFIVRLEHEVSCILKKPRCQNIKMTRLHISETNNEIAKEIDNTGERWFKVYDPEDGKLCFLIDNSFNLHEFEAVKSKTAVPDMRKVGNVFLDIRNNETYLPSDAKSIIDKLVGVSSNMIEYSLRTNENIAWLAENIKTHGPAWFGITKEAGNIRKEVKRLSGILSQKNLKEYF